jgi:hypothetical protein
MTRTEEILIIAAIFLPGIGWLVGHHMGADQVRKEYMEFYSRVEWPGVCDEAIRRTREDFRLEQEYRSGEDSQLYRD